MRVYRSLVVQDLNLWKWAIVAVEINYSYGV